MVHDSQDLGVPALARGIYLGGSGHNGKRNGAFDYDIRHGDYRLDADDRRSDSESLPIILDSVRSDNEPVRFRCNVFSLQQEINRSIFLLF